MLYVTSEVRFRPKRISRFMRKLLSCTYHRGTVQVQIPVHGCRCEPNAADADNAADVRMLAALALCVGR